MTVGQPRSPGPCREKRNGTSRCYMSILGNRNTRPTRERAFVYEDVASHLRLIGGRGSGNRKSERRQQRTL
jgi:hypothetical protein